MTEFALLARLAPYLTDSGSRLATGPGDVVVVGTGDDAAVLRLGGTDVVIAVDVLVDGVHVRRDVSSMADVGWKALAVNCSDLAAMGAVPAAGVIGLCRPSDLPVADVEALYGGLREAAARWGVELVGGDTVRADRLSVSVSLVGTVAPGAAVTRDGARPGDRILCVGALGGAAAALVALDAGHTPAPSLLAAHRRPRALVAAGRALAAAGAHAMIDVSDGLGADLGHICTASGLRARVRWDHLPIAAGAVTAAIAGGADPVDVVVGGGEDFALVATVRADAVAAAIAAVEAVENVPVAVIGEVLDAGGGPEVVLSFADGSTREVSSSGWDHYADVTRPAGSPP